MSWIPHILQHRRQTQPKCTILSRLKRAMRSPDRGLRRRFYNKPYLQEEFVCIWIWLQRIWWEPLSWIWRVWGNPGWSWCSAVCTPRPEKQWTNRHLWTSKTCINWKKLWRTDYPESKSGVFSTSLLISVNEGKYTENRLTLFLFYMVFRIHSLIKKKKVGHTRLVDCFYSIYMYIKRQIRVLSNYSMYIVKIRSLIHVVEGESGSKGQLVA